MSGFEGWLREVGASFVQPRAGEGSPALGRANLDVLRTSLRDRMAGNELYFRILFGFSLVLTATTLVAVLWSWGRGAGWAPGAFGISTAGAAVMAMRAVRDKHSFDMMLELATGLDDDSVRQVLRVLVQKYSSSKASERQITISPLVFQVPEDGIEDDMVALMMPFDKRFDLVRDAIARACRTCSLRCVRADDVWQESVIMQDVFRLIFRARIVVVDFTGRNANVMYETGIAHALGRHVIPITQSMDDVPFDMSHHRVLKYLPVAEGISVLEQELQSKLSSVGS